MRALLFPLVASVALAQNPPTGGAAPATPPQTGAAQGAGQGGRGGAAQGPRPYPQVITDRARTEQGVLTVHKVGDRFFIEIPDSAQRREFLFVSRVAALPQGQTGGFAGTSKEERVIKFERIGDRVIMRSQSYLAVADDSLPIARGVERANYTPVLAAFPVQAYGRDSASVIDITDFFAGDTPAISGMNAAERRTYGVRRLDLARSWISNIRAFPTNVEVRHVQTFDAAEPPGEDRSGSTISLEMRQSIVLLPKVPMRGRYADERVGFFGVERVNYGLDELKAASQRFIVRWRLEPKDPAAYARGELVEPIKPIIYYVDPATPARWAPYVKEGVDRWSKVFEKAGFKNAVQGRYAPKNDPDFDPDDARYSMVRWAASLTRNAVGPQTHDPRTGEILNSEINWYHNHMRSYRNRLLIETGAANTGARSLNISEEVIGETMRGVITHEVGHALGLPHNMIASSSIPVDSLRNKSFASRYGVSLTIMDYARQNYIAQPGDGLAPLDFIRRLGPFDDFVINWGYRYFPEAKTPEAEKPILNKMLADQKGMFAYRFGAGNYTGVDPRNQTEDMGDDPVRASGFAVMNMKKVFPNLVAWTTKPGEDYSDLEELYNEALGQWGLYMGHVTNVVGGVFVDNKTADQGGNVYRIVPKARQKSALAFIGENVFTNPSWLMPADVMSRLGQPTQSLSARAGNVLNNLLSNARLGRMAEAESFDAANAYPVAEFMGDVRATLFNGASPDQHRRAVQRAYLERLGAIINPPPAAAPAAGAGGRGGAPQTPAPFTAPPTLSRSDLPALARAELRAVQASARTSGAAATGVLKAHWMDVDARVSAILEPGRR
jgi:hypothetical protein